MKTTHEIIIGENVSEVKKIDPSKYGTYEKGKMNERYGKGLCSKVPNTPPIQDNIKEVWICHADCPVRLLDQQSGILKSGGKAGKQYKHLTSNGNVFVNSNKVGDYTAPLISDKGGASRFFKTFNRQTRFIYKGKAHKSERNKGCEGLYWRKITDDEFEQITKQEYDLLPKDNRAKGNNVSTLKPINVMRYLVRLVCPKGGMVLDPFGGSGTTAIACIIEGMNYTLIEKRERFAKVIIPKRLEWWSNPDNWLVLKDHNALPKVKTLKIKKQNKCLDNWVVSS